MLTLERETPEAAAVPAAPVKSAKAWPLVAMVAGLVFLAVAATALAGSRGRPAPLPAAPAPAPVTSVDPLAITLSARDVSVVTQVYASGEESGWHRHSGIHAVAILSGVLTVYDGECRAQTFDADRPYVGGQEAHLVRNEGDAPVVMAVTYLSPAAGSEQTRRLPPPAGC